MNAQKPNSDRNPIIVDIESVGAYCARADRGPQALPWPGPFVLPAWMGAWHKVFGADCKPLILRVRSAEKLLALAPLMIQNRTASFLGDPQICDYFDFTVPGVKSLPLFSSLLRHLQELGLQALDLRAMRPDAAALHGMRAAAEAHGCRMRCEADGVSAQIELPEDWHGFMQLLNGKQRHEIRRKERRLAESGPIAWQVLQDRLALDQMSVFFKLFTAGRKDKVAFLTPKMRSFFQSMAASMARIGLLRLLMLKIDREPAAATLFLDDGRTVYLYNNGYDPRFRHLSVGLLSKVATIREAIARRRHCFDFLKGAETYKLQLGGKPVALTRCRIDLKA